MLFMTSYSRPRDYLRSEMITVDTRRLHSLTGQCALIFGEGGAQAPYRRILTEIAIQQPLEGNNILAYW
jgi:hypothetical protein